MEKQCLESDRKVGERQEHGRCLGAPTPISAAISFDSILLSGIDIHPSSRTISPQVVHSVSAVGDLHLFELLKTVGVLDIVADERAAARPSLNRQHKAGFALLRLKSMRSHMLLMV